MEKLDVIERFKNYGDDVNKNDLICFAISNGFFDDIFVYLNNDEKRNYAFCLSSSRLVAYLSELSYDESFLIIFDSIMKPNFNFSVLIDLCYFLDDCYKFEIIKLFRYIIPFYYYDKIICSICDEGVMVKMISYLIDTDYSIYSLGNIVCNLSEDLNKEKFLDILPVRVQIKVLNSFKDKNLVKKYVFLDKYSNYKSALVVSTGDEDFIKEQYLESKSSIFRKNILSNIDDERFKLELIRRSGEEKLSYFYESNFDEYFGKYLVDVDLDEINRTLVSPDITVGIELELCNKDVVNYKGFRTVLKDYVVAEDSTLKKGIEIISPVIGYNKEDLQRLKSVCMLLKKCDFYTSRTCGGHVHIGANYLSMKEDYFMLLYLYSNCEDIIYLITDKEGSVKRSNASVYAKKVKDVFIRAVREGVISEKQSFEDLVDSLSYLNNSRYKGLNFNNLGSVDKNTIEFRMPNGEMDFKEILANIKLFAMLVQRSHDLNISCDKDKELEVIGSNVSDKKKLEALLNTLFDNEEDKKVYKRRYRANNKLISSIQRKFFRGNGIKMDIKEKRLIRWWLGFFSWLFINFCAFALKKI